MRTKLIYSRVLSTTAVVLEYGIVEGPVLSSTWYRAVSQFFDAFENNSNFGQKVLTGTDFRSRFVKMALSH